MIIQGIRTSIAKKPYIVIFQGEEFRTSCPNLGPGGTCNMADVTVFQLKACVLLGVDTNRTVFTDQGMIQPFISGDLQNMVKVTKILISSPPTR